MILPPDSAAVNSPASLSPAPVESVVCRDCAGEGRVSAISCLSGGCSFAPVTCRRCGGSGRLSPERAASVEAGESMRADRIGRGLNVREVADRLGVEPRDLSRRERGEV